MACRAFAIILAVAATWSGTACEPSGKPRRPLVTSSEVVLRVGVPEGVECTDCNLATVPSVGGELSLQIRPALRLDLNECDVQGVSRFEYPVEGDLYWGIMVILTESGSYRWGGLLEKVGALRRPAQVVVYQDSIPRGVVIDSAGIRTLSVGGLSSGTDAEALASAFQAGGEDCPVVSADPPERSRTDDASLEKFEDALSRDVPIDELLDAYESYYGEGRGQDEK